MMNEAILDTNYIIALIDDKDKRAVLAEQLSIELKVRRVKAVYLDCVLNTDFHSEKDTLFSHDVAHNLKISLL